MVHNYLTQPKLGGWGREDSMHQQRWDINKVIIYVMTVFLCWELNDSSQGAGLILNSFGVGHLISIRLHHKTFL